MIKKIFVSIIIIFYIFVLSFQSYASVVMYNGYMHLTPSGEAKVASRASVVSAGITASQMVLPMAVAGTLLLIGMTVYRNLSVGQTSGDRDRTVMQVSIPAVSVPPPESPPSEPVPATSSTQTSTVGDWGRKDGSSFLVAEFTYPLGVGWCMADGTLQVLGANGYPLDNGGYQQTFSREIPSGFRPIGGYTSLTQIGCNSSAGVVYHKFGESVYERIELTTVLDNEGVPWWDGTTGDSTGDWDKRFAVEKGLADAKAVAEAKAISEPQNSSYYRYLSNTITAALEALKPIGVDAGDYTISGSPAVDNTYTEGSDPELFVPAVPAEEAPPIEEVPPVEEVPPIPDNACVEYQRKKSFDYSSLLQSAQAVPLLGLLSKLVINPAAGQFDGKVTFQLSKFGTQEIDLNKWHYSDAIAIFRFVIIGGAFLTAIRIIYD